MRFRVISWIVLVPQVKKHEANLSLSSSQVVSCKVFVK